MCKGGGRYARPHFLPLQVTQEPGAVLSWQVGAFPELSPLELGQRLQNLCTQLQRLVGERDAALQVRGPLSPASTYECP